MNITRPPFRVDTAQSPEEAAEEIVRVFNRLKDQSGKTSRVFSVLMACRGADAEDPLIRAGLRLAESIDGDDSGFELPYHNSQHVCEVMLCSHFLALLHGLDHPDAVEIIAAALYHDFRHDGKNLGPLPFRLERHAVLSAEPFLQSAGVAADLQRRLAACILATNTAAGLPVALAYHARKPSAGSGIPDAAHELAELRVPRVAKQAMILCLADVLPSLGLTIPHALALQENLAQEWRTPLGIKDKLRFLDNAIGLFAVGEFFLPNVAQLRTYLMARSETVHHADDSR